MESDIQLAPGVQGDGPEVHGTGPGVHRLIPLFLGKRCHNITFVVDTSEAMSSVLGSVKRLLIQTLLTKASLRDSLFNIITFSYKVNMWSHHMLPCAPDSVYEALSWVHSLSCSPGRDLLAGLSTAFADPACHSVHLVTRDLPDRPEAALKALPAVSAGRSLSVFYLSESNTGPLDDKTRDFLQCLTHTTGGSCYLLPIKTDRSLEKVIPLFVGVNSTSVTNVSPVKRCSGQSSPVLIPKQHTHFPVLRCSLGNPFCPTSSCVLSGRTLAITEFLPGCRVLARRETDSLYYLGTVLHEVQGRRGLWVVEFDHPCSAAAAASDSLIYSETFRQQLVCSPDMINHTKAHSHQLGPGDTVLTPWEPVMKRYGPGRVLTGMEHRDHLKADSAAAGLQVLMWDGSVIQVPADLAVFIHASHHERVVRELSRTTAVVVPRPCLSDCRLCLHSSSSCSPQTLYRCCCERHCQSAATCVHCCPLSFRPTWPPSLIYPCCEYSPSASWRAGFETAELERKVDVQLEGLRNTARSSEPPGVESSSPSSTSPAPAEEGETSLELGPPPGKIEEEQRPPWRYWKRNAPEPQHRQPGKTVPSRTSHHHPVRFSYPVLQFSASPNHSSLFQPLPASGGRTRSSMRDVFGLTLTDPKHRPTPPVGFQSLSEHAPTVLYT